jgi:hypothetical protein
MNLVNYYSEGMKYSPSLASRWAIATSATKKTKSRRISISPFLPKDNYHSSTRSTMERTASGKTLSCLEEKHDCNYDFGDDDIVMPSMLLKRGRDVVN